LKRKFFVGFDNLLLVACTGFNETYFKLIYEKPSGKRGQVVPLVFVVLLQKEHFAQTTISTTSSAQVAPNKKPDKFCRVYIFYETGY